MTDFKKLEELHKKLEKINSEYDPDMNFVKGLSQKNRELLTGANKFDWPRVSRGL